jgi:hypothetical protein
MVSDLFFYQLMLVALVWLCPHSIEFSGSPLDLRC